MSTGVSGDCATETIGEQRRFDMRTEDMYKLDGSGKSNFRRITRYIRTQRRLDLLHDCLGL